MTRFATHRARTSTTASMPLPAEPRPIAYLYAEPPSGAPLVVLQRQSGLLGPGLVAATLGVTALLASITPGADTITSATTLMATIVLVYGATVVVRAVRSRASAAGLLALAGVAAAAFVVASAMRLFA